MGEKINMAEIGSRRESKTPVPPPRLSPFEGTSCNLATLGLVAGVAGAVGGIVVFCWLVGPGEGIEDLLFIGAIGLLGGLFCGIYGGVVAGQIARVIFQMHERRYYQLAGAFATGALCGAVWAYGYLWAIFSAMTD